MAEPKPIIQSAKVGKARQTFRSHGVRMKNLQTAYASAKSVLAETEAQEGALIESGSLEELAEAPRVREKVKSLKIMVDKQKRICTHMGIRVKELEAEAPNPKEMIALDESIANSIRRMSDAMDGMISAADEGLESMAVVKSKLGVLDGIWPLQLYFQKVQKMEREFDGFRDSPTTKGAWRWDAFSG